MTKHIGPILLVILFSACGTIVAINEDGGAPDAGDVVPPDADPCETETCECVVDTDCGFHEVCDTSGPGRLCICADQYTDSGTGCSWAGAPSDPSFQDVSAWQSTGAAVVVPLATGSVAPGAAAFDSTAVCELATVSQTVTMPSYELAEALAVAVTHRANGMNMANTMIAAGGYWRPLQTFGSYQTMNVCLGDAAYGGDIDFRVGPNLNIIGVGLCSGSTLDVDHLQIDPDASCPRPGDIRNRDFEDTQGWVATTGAGIVAAIGADNSSAGRLSTQNLCAGSSLTGLASPPSKLASPALELYWHATSGDEVQLLLSQQEVTRFTGSGPSGATTSRICLPHGMMGWAHDLTFSLPYSSGSCASPDVREAVLDDLLLVDEPACGTTPNIVDGGFEAAHVDNLITPWVFTQVSGRSQAQVIGSADIANTGNASLQLLVKQECSNASASTWVTVPAASGNNGPAVQFAYLTGNNPETTLSTNLSSNALAEANTYATITQCLEPLKAGRMQQLRFTLSPGGGACATTFADEIARVDDIVVTTSASCPIN